MSGSEHLRAVPGGCNTPFSPKNPIYRVKRFGYDDLSIGFDLNGSGSAERLRKFDSRATSFGLRLGTEASYGKFENMLGRSASIWNPKTNRLYVQWKPAAPGELLDPDHFSAEFLKLQERMAVIGVESFEPSWVTRMDVAVDLECEPAAGKLLLDALSSVRLGGGNRVTTDGDPRSTVYFRPPVSDDVLARSYCRNLKTRQGLPFGLIRLEAVQRFDPQQWWTRYLDNGRVAAGVIWEARYGKLSGKVRRFPREVQVVKLAALVKMGEIGPREFERMTAFLDAERLGLSPEIYSPSQLSERRREAKRLGLSPNDVDDEPVDLDLGELLKPAQAVWAA